MKSRRGLEARLGSTFQKVLGLSVIAGALYVGAYSATAAQSGGQSAASDLERGKAIYTEKCLACHGPAAAGNKDLHAPALFMQEEWYIVAQLQKFREGSRGTDPQDLSGVIMRPMALSLESDADLPIVAAYIKTLKGAKPAKTVTGDVAAGQKTFGTVCVPCHGANATGNKDLKSPRLVGQHDWYLALQIQKFKDGHRGANSKDVTGQQMRAMAATLPTEASINDVVSYLATLEEK